LEKRREMEKVERALKAERDVRKIKATTILIEIVVIMVYLKNVKFLRNS
jgi:hypothetical protein